jgi:hypothetical protein
MASTGFCKQLFKGKKVPCAWGTVYPHTYVNELAESLISWVEDNLKKNKAFLLGDWALANGVNPKHVSYLATKTEEFKVAYDLAKAFQEHMVCKGALERRLDPRFSQFYLVAHHGYSMSEVKQREEELKNDFAEFLSHMRHVNGTPAPKEEKSEPQATVAEADQSSQ